MYIKLICTTENITVSRWFTPCGAVYAARSLKKLYAQIARLPEAGASRVDVFSPFLLFFSRFSVERRSADASPGGFTFDTRQLAVVLRPSHILLLPRGPLFVRQRAE